MAEADFRFLIFDFRLRLFVCFVLSCFSTVHADEGLKITPVERWSNVFAESESRWTYRVSTDGAFRERAAWRLTLGQRTLRYEAYVDRRVQILVEGPSKRPERMMGRTRCGKIVVFDGSDRHRGQLMDVQVTRAGNFTLYGDPAVVGME